MTHTVTHMNEARFSNIFIEKRASTCPQSLEKSRLFSYALLVSECENFQNMKRIFGPVKIYAQNYLQARLSEVNRQ